MPSFMPIGPNLWALEGHIQTDTQSSFYYVKFVLLQASPAVLLYSVTSLHWALYFTLVFSVMLLPQALLCAHILGRIRVRLAAISVFGENRVKISASVRLEFCSLTNRQTHRQTAMKIQPLHDFVEVQ